MGTAIPFMKFMYGGKIAEEHTLTAKGYVLNPSHANKKNSQLCLYSECKIPLVVYAVNWEPNKLPEQEIANNDK